MTGEWQIECFSKMRSRWRHQRKAFSPSQECSRQGKESCVDVTQFDASLDEVAANGSIGNCNDEHVHCEAKAECDDDVNAIIKADYKKKKPF